LGDLVGEAERGEAVLGAENLAEAFVEGIAKEFFEALIVVSCDRGYVRAVFVKKSRPTQARWVY